jgi:MoaA/NifB/PqqE/SkfB family radical SAM enzyme
MIPRLPSIIEFHISNVCTGRCVVCSKAHGGTNNPMVSDEVIDRAIDRLQEASGTWRLQLGGDGDSFLHSGFLAYCATMRRRLPGSHHCLFTSAYLLTPERSDDIIEERLLDEVQIRVDSLDPAIYRKSTGLDLETVLFNIRYFAAKNDHAHLCIIYMPLYRYRQTCRERLNKEPTYFGRVDVQSPGLCLKALRNEYVEMCEYFRNTRSQFPIEVRTTGISLWAERTDCAFSDAPCPRLPENTPGDMSRQLYIYPNGNYGLCGYDDAQCEFILGNVFDHSIREVWNGPQMQEYMNRIRNRTPDDHPACCVNPEACKML